MAQAVWSAFTSLDTTAIKPAIRFHRAATPACLAQSAELCLSFISRVRSLEDGFFAGVQRLEAIGFWLICLGYAATWSRKPDETS